MKTKLIAEALGTAFLVMIVFGSGIMGETLSQDNPAIALFVNSVATGAGLFVLIQCLGPISGAHINPVVSFTEYLWRRMNLREMSFYMSAQIIGGLSGVLLVHLMFGLPLLQLSQVSRPGINLLGSEVVATFGLICVVALAGRKHAEFAPLSVSAYIVSAYWFTSSTGFTNPAVTLARGFTNTFCGMSLNHFSPYVLSQFVGAGLAYFVVSRIPTRP